MRALALFLVLFALALPAQAQQPDEAVATPDWRSFNEAIDEAAAADRIVMIAALADWCSWCRRLEQETFADGTVRAYLGDHFTSVRLNVEGQDEVTLGDQPMTEADLATALGVQSVPAIVVLGPDGEYITQIRGYYPPDHFFVMLRYINEADYEAESFEEFAERVSTP